VAAVQLAGTYVTAGHLTYQQGRLSEPRRVLYLRGHLTAPSWVLHQQGHLTGLDWALVTVGPVALVARRRHPVAALWLASVVTLAPYPLWFGYLSLIVAFFAAAASGHRRAAWTAVAAGYLATVWLAPLAWNKPVASASTALFLAAWVAVLVIAAEALRMRRERAAEATAARQLAARHQASEERLRMARELHDVIGHNISLINVQAGVGLDLMDTQPEQARAALAAVKAVSKEALGELRTMLAALRQDGDRGSRSPVPGLGRLPELVSLTRAAGLAVTTDVAGEPRALPAGVDLAAYRIVQESLTNVARHAGPAAVTVRITYGERDLGIEIADDGRLAAGNGRGEAGTGNGIPGMRERALALGGRLDAGPRPGGGFQVRARLPLGGAR
jgi:signal transduction histidine kinase